MSVFEYKQRLIEVIFVSPTNDDPVTLECTDLRSEMLFTIFRDKAGELVFRSLSENIPLDLIQMVATMANEGL